MVNSSSHGAVTLQDNEGTLFKVNGHRLKLFLNSNIEPEELDVIEFFTLPKVELLENYYFETRPES